LEDQAQAPYEIYSKMPFWLAIASGMRVGTIGEHTGRILRWLTEQLDLGCSAFGLRHLGWQTPWQPSAATRPLSASECNTNGAQHLSCFPTLLALVGCFLWRHKFPDCASALQQIRDQSGPMKGRSRQSERAENRCLTWPPRLGHDFSSMLAVKPMGRRLGTGGCMSWRMAERMAAMASSWVVSFLSSRVSSCAKAV
jgi:hypothetical protein